MSSKSRPLEGIAGIDEAGRGPMIGPMIVCGILFKLEDIPKLNELGARDSKLLTAKNRRALAGPIRDISRKVALRAIPASEIDQLRGRGVTLNEIEVRAFVSVAEELQPRELYLDAADVLAERFGKEIGERSGLSAAGCRIVSEHKADSKYEVVSAASIIAKVERDEAISRLIMEHGDLGSGYPNDPKTVDFVRNLVRSGEELPSFVRKSWDSVKRIIEENDSVQATLNGT
ncbi:MAG: ribonuclease HII [Promethearchaeota archaeon]